MSSVMEVIAHYHQCSVARHDIKLNNVLFNDRNRLNLTNFGLVNWFSEGNRSMRGIVETPYCVGLKVITGRDYTKKVDVWS